MPKDLALVDVEHDPYTISVAAGLLRPLMHVLWTGYGNPPRDMLLDLPSAIQLRDWLNQWLAEQGQGAGEEADDGRVS